MPRIARLVLKEEEQLPAIFGRSFVANPHRSFTTLAVFISRIGQI